MRGDFGRNAVATRSKLFRDHASGPLKGMDTPTALKGMDTPTAFAGLITVLS
jgi:hypothetical protein